MEKQKTDDKVEQYIAQAIVRKGEQEAVDELAKVESVGALKQVMDAAERKHRPGSAMALSGRGHLSVARRRYLPILISLSVAAAIIAAVLFIGLQPRYSTGELYSRWRDSVVYEPFIVRGGDEAAELQRKSLESAIACADSGETGQAIEKLIPIASDRQSEYREDAQWLLVVVYLRIDERMKAEKILREIVENKGSLSDEAKELMNEINMKRWF